MEEEHLRTQEERLALVVDMARRLKNYKLPNGTVIDLYQDHYKFIPDLKIVFNDYVRQDDKNPIDFGGSFKFEDIGKEVEYLLPASKKKDPKLVIKMQIDKMKF